MIERFNFYDLYGYLIPGLVLLLCLGVPFAINGRWPESSEWMVLIVGVVVAYIVGHLLQAIAAIAMPSSKANGKARAYDSTLILDPNDTTFSVYGKERISENVKSWFNLDLEVHSKADDRIGPVRQDAFFLARRVVNEASNYSEQFEGIYVMMRGCAVALWCGAAFTLGYCIGNVMAKPATIGLGFYFLAWFSILSTVDIVEKLWPVRFKRIMLKLTGQDRRILSRWSIALVLGTLVCIGTFVAKPQADSTLRVELLALVLLYLAASLRFWNGYFYFAHQFAKSVWLHFAAEPTNRPESSIRCGSREQLFPGA